MANNITSSAIVAEVVSGSHVVKIDGYSRVKLMENGKYVSSVPFSVGGHSWFIKYYPNGNNTDSKDYLSVFLTLGSACAMAMKANFSFALLDKNANRTLYTPSREKVQISATPSSSRKLIKLEGSVHLMDDSFSIKIDVTVMKDICSKETTQQQFVVVPPGDLH
uniref:MATH domain-containing protein n=1 Tax=Oryza barthii TaxID=65489 RepID=A0A0D3F457_9ORYZ